MRANRGKRSRRIVYRWHRRIGLTTALFVLFLAISGLALNHTEGLRLDERYVTGAWLQDWYGLGVPARVVGVRTGDHRVTLLGDALYLDAARIDGFYDELTGAVHTNDQIHVAVDGALLVLLPDGRLVERLGPVNGIPEQIEAIGVTADNRLALRTTGAVLTADRFVSEWQAGDDAGTIRWSVLAPVPPALIDELRDSYRDHMLSFERVVLDLHSGRMFGAVGPLIMDVVSVLFVVLAVSGFWMWWRRPPSTAPPMGRSKDGRASRR